MPSRHPLARPTLLGERLTRPRVHALPLVYRLLAHAPEKDTGDRLWDDAMALVEAVLLSADEPLPARRIAAAAGLPDTTSARQALRRLRELHESLGSAYQVEEVANGFQLLTRPEYLPWLTRLRKDQAELRLSGAAKETLAVVAYRQPITRADVEAVRGVQCGEILRHLMEKGLVRICGRDPSLGRPVLYATTKKFLQHFGLRSLSDLPQSPDLGPPPARTAHEEEPGGG
jgi:segregation and condensation protein B